MAYTTSKTLLQGISNRNEDSWKRFESFYSPLIEICGKDYRLTRQEIDELKQDVLVSVFKEQVVEKYEVGRGRFRDYFRAIIHHKAYAIRKHRKEHCQCDNLENIPEAPEAWTQWDEEWQSFVFGVALSKLRQEVTDEQYMSFDMYVLKKMSPIVVADALDTTVDVVYQNKTRLMSKLKEIVSILKDSLQ